MKLSNKAIVIGNGKDCPKCKKPMDRKKHPLHWKNTKNYYYTEWDHCKNCQHIQHYEEFKSGQWKEAEEQESFFKNLR